MPRPNYHSVDDYIAAQPEHAREPLERLRATIQKALPRATEGISYQIPIYKLDGGMVVYFAGFPHHYSIYPATAHLVSVLKKELAGYLHNKATIRFSYDKAVPTQLIKRIVKLRAEEASALLQARAAKRAAGKKKSTAAKKKATPAKAAVKKSAAARKVAAKKTAAKKSKARV